MDWKTKLTSRKFWVALASFVAMMLTAFFGKSESEAAQVTALIMAGASVVAYIVGEGLVDAADCKATITVTDTTGDLQQAYDDYTEEEPEEEDGVTDLEYPEKREEETEGNG